MKEASAPAAAPGKKESFKDLVRASLSAEQKKALNKAAWEERLFSLWCPVTVFGLVFAVYICIVEASTCAYLSLQTPLKLFGLVCIGYWAALIVLGQAWGPFKRMRKARREGEELYNEVEEVMKKRADQLPAKAREELTELTQQLLIATAANDEKKLSEAVNKLDASADKHLMKWRKGGALDFAKGFGKALLVALAIRTVLIEPYKIPSGSMVPTLEIGDQIFVNKFIYGVRIPFTNWVPFKIVREPKRGDVIVFNNPVDTEKDFVKRVIGVPGDVIDVENNVVTINGVAQPYQVEAADYPWWDQENGAWLLRSGSDDLVRETLDGQVHYAFHGHRPLEFCCNPVTVPPGHVFVMGDNRDHSADSRLNLSGNPPNKVAFVPYGNIKGKAMVIWLSLAHGGLGQSLFDHEILGIGGGSGLRTDRLFQEVTLCGNEPVRTSK